MNKRTLAVCAVFAAGLEAGLMLISAAHATDTPAVAVVRQFLAAQAAGDPQRAYALLSAASKRGVSPQGYAADLPPQFFSEYVGADPIYAVGLLFNDPKNMQRSRYRVVGGDPKNPALVLISWAGLSGDFSLTVSVATVTDPATKAVRVDMLRSIEAAYPPVPPGAGPEEKSRFISLRNLTVLAFSLLQYARSHDNRFPDSAHWTDKILPSIENPALLRTPAAPAGQNYSYAFNRNLSGQPLSAVPYPIGVVLLFKSTKGVKNASDTGQSLPPFNRRTGAQYEYAFVDGSAESETSFIKTDNSERFKLDKNK